MSIQTNSGPKQSNFVQFVMCLTLVLMLGTCSYRFVSPTAREGREIFRDLATHDIRYIRIEPAEYSSLVAKPVVIQDKQAIAEIAHALSHLSTHWPNHPNVTRAAVVRIQLEDRAIGGELRESSNNGTTFYYISGINRGWVFSTYRVPSNRHIFAIIERAIAEQSADLPIPISEQP